MLKCLLEILHRTMTSWANMKVVPSAKKQTLRSYFSPLSDDFAEATLGFLYSFVHTQRNAEPFYIYDTQGYFQDLLNGNPIVHYLKEEPSCPNLASDIPLMAGTVSKISTASLKRYVSSVYQYNSLTRAKIDEVRQNFGLLKQPFDVGIVLDISGTAQQAIQTLKTLQKRTGKKTLSVFVMTDSINLIRDFATQGDSTWKYVSLLRNNQPTTKEYTLLKTLTELEVLKGLEFTAARFASPVAKLLYLSSETQILSLDGQGWKA